MTLNEKEKEQVWRAMENIATATQLKHLLPENEEDDQSGTVYAIRIELERAIAFGLAQGRAEKAKLREALRAHVIKDDGTGNLACHECLAGSWAEGERECHIPSCLAALPADHKEG